MKLDPSEPTADHTAFLHSLPDLLATAIRWASTESKRAWVTGTMLTPSETEIALAVGVKRPELVRITATEMLSLPSEQGLKEALALTGLLGPRMAGLTLGYTVFLSTQHYSSRLLSHELRHVHQYEKAGSIDSFLALYLRQIVTFGYARAPLELDAVAHEIKLRQG